jgi:hypothetical protein
VGGSINTCAAILLRFSLSFFFKLAVYVANAPINVLLEFRTTQPRTLTVYFHRRERFREVEGDLGAQSQLKCSFRQQLN